MKKNIILMILFYLKRATLLIASACLFLLAACTDPNDDFIPGTQNDQSKVTIVVTVPGAKLPTTRGMADNKGEETVKEIDILVFDSDASPEKLEEHVAVAEGDIEPGTDGGSEYKVVFKAALSSRTTKSRLVIVANAHEQVTTMLGAISSAKTKKEVMENLLFATTGNGEDRKWKADGDTKGGYTPIPMYAEKPMDKIQSGSQIDAIELQRMLARIDVINNATAEFTLEKIHLVNYNLAGYIAPAWDTDNGNLLANPLDEDPYIPGSPKTQLGTTNALAYTYTHGTNGYEGEIYTYESVAAKDGTSNDTGRKNATCLVLEGKMAGDDVTPHFYRVDFTKYQETISDPDDVPYIPLRRNHKYKVDVLAVKGVGYGSLADALNSYTVVSNLKTRVIAYDQGTIKDVVYDGQYMLGVEEGEYEVTKEIHKVKVKVFTDSPKGWTATIPVHTGNWLTFDGNVTSVTGACGDNDASLTFCTKDYTGSGNREAKIVVTAGRLTHEIIVKQTDKSSLWIKVTDEDGNPLDKVEYVCFQGVTKLKPTKIFVSWGGADEIHITPRTGSVSNRFEYDNGYDQISGTYTGGYKVFTIMANEDVQLYYSHINEKVMEDRIGFRVDAPNNSSSSVIVFLDLSYYFARGRMSYPYVGAFWRWNQSGERLIRMCVPAGEWNAEVIEGDHFIRLDTEQTADPDVWYKDRIPADMNLESNDMKYRLPVNAKTKVSGTAKSTSEENISNLYFRIGLTGPHPDGSDAGIEGSAIPRYGKVLVTYPEGSQTIYIRQGEAAVEFVPNSGVRWATYNMSDPQRGEGGYDVNDHNNVQVGETEFLPEKFTNYPSQIGYYFQWNRVKAYNPGKPYASGYEGRISGWPLDYENTWSGAQDVCPKGYRHPKGKYNDTTSEYNTGLLGDNPGTDNSIWGYYADGFFDRNYLTNAIVSNGPVSKTYGGSDAAYVGRLFFDTQYSTSLFFSATGRRITSTHAGTLDSSDGKYAYYFAADVGGSVVGSTYFSESDVKLSYTDKNTGNIIRCVKGDKQ